MPNLNSGIGKRKYPLILLALVFMYVALNAGFALLQPSSDATRKLHDFSFFTDHRTQERRLLEQESSELLKPLEFMVWSQQREKLGESYAQALRRQINAQPFNFKLWPQLVYAQGETKTMLAEQRWTMGRALTLSRWSLRDRSLIMRPCLSGLPEAIQDDLTDLCTELLTSLPESMSANQLSMLIGVSPHKLQDALIEQGLRKPQGLDK